MVAIEQEIITDRQFQFISERVKEHCGINLHDGKKDLVRADRRDEHEPHELFP